MGTPEVWRQLGAGIARAVERHLLEESEEAIDIYATLPPVVFASEGWLLWQPPRGCDAEFTPTEARFKAWSEKATVYLAAPEKYAVSDLPTFTTTFLPTFETSYHSGGVARVMWLPYDARGWRVFTPPVETTVPVGLNQTIAVPPALDSRVAFLRPSFRLTGAFGDFAARVSRR